MLMFFNSYYANRVDLSEKATERPSDLRGTRSIESLGCLHHLAQRLGAIASAPRFFWRCRVGAGAVWFQRFCCWRTGDGGGSGALALGNVFDKNWFGEKR